MTGTSVDLAETAALRLAGSQLLRIAVARLRQLAHPRGGWSDFWLEPGCSTSWVTAYVGCALADAADAPGVSGGHRAEADALVQTAADRLLAAQRDGAWGWAEGMRADADATAWAVRLLLAARRPVPPGSWDVLVRHLGIVGAATTELATGARTAPMPEVTAAALSALDAGEQLDVADLAAGWQAVLATADVDRTAAGIVGPGFVSVPDIATPPAVGGTAQTSGSGVWRSPLWPGSGHPTAVVLDGLRRVGIGPEPPGVTGSGDEPDSADGHASPTGRAGPSARSAAAEVPAETTFELADALWIGALRGRPDPRIAEALLERQLPSGGWAGDALLLVPAQDGERQSVITHDARGVFTTATVLHAAVALLHATLAEGAEAVGARSNGTYPVPSSAHRSAPRRDERWDAVIARAAEAGGVSPERALEVFRMLTRESLAGGSPWPSPQLSLLASGTPVELSAGPAPGLRLTCEVGDPRLSPPARLRSGLLAVERTAQLLGMGQAWAGRRAQVLDVLADPMLAVPEGCRFWLWAGIDLPSGGPPVLKAYLSLHAGDVDDWRSRLHEALRALPPGGSIWPALSCLRGAGWCHEVGIGELPGGHWGLKVYFELDRWRPDRVAELLATTDLNASLTELTPDIPGVIRAAQRGPRRTGIALRVNPVTGDVTELTTAVALPPPLVGRAELTDRVAAWLESRGQDPGPLRATVAAVEPDWAGAAPTDRMFGLVTLSAGHRGPSATVYVRPRPASPQRA